MFISSFKVYREENPCHSFIYKFYTEISAHDLGNFKSCFSYFGDICSTKFSEINRVMPPAPWEDNLLHFYRLRTGVSKT